MANIKSAKKRIKVIAAKTAQNKATKSELKTVLKKAQIALETGADNSEELVRVAVKKIDQACSKGLLHKNSASRKKSGLARKLNAAG